MGASARRATATSSTCRRCCGLGVRRPAAEGELERHREDPGDRLTELVWGLTLQEIG